MKIEDALSEMKRWIQYEKDNKSKILRADELIDIQETIVNEIEKQNKMIRKAYAEANNYLYFNDSADYCVGLWEVVRALRPDLAEKWDNGETPELRYIEMEE